MNKIIEQEKSVKRLAKRTRIRKVIQASKDPFVGIRTLNYPRK